MNANTEKQRRYRAYVYADPDRYSKYRAMMRKHEAQYRAKRRAQMAVDPAMLAEFKSKHRVWIAKFHDKERLLKGTKAEYYAVWRAERRGRYAAKVIASGRTYRPNYAGRVPDWAKFRQPILDTRSVFLFENVTPSMRAYARQLAIERKGGSVR